MAIQADIVLRARGGLTIIDIQVDEVHAGTYHTVWDLRTSIDRREPDDAAQPQAWLCEALKHLLQRLDCDHVDHQGDDEAAAANPAPAEITLDLGEQLLP